MVLGVLGKIASGKSHVLSLLKGLGFCVIDCDQIVSDLYLSGGKGAEVIAEHFGLEYLKPNGDVDRLSLRNLVFDDFLALEKLNSLIHPLVVEAVSTELESISADVAIEASYFDSPGLGDLIGKLMWVERDESLIRSSLVERAFPLPYIDNVISLIKKPEHVDYLLLNEGDIFDKLSSMFNK